MCYISTEAHGGYINLKDKSKAKGNRSEMEKNNFTEKQKFFPSISPKAKIQYMLHNEKTFPHSRKSAKETLGHYRKKKIPVKYRHYMV